MENYPIKNALVECISKMESSGADIYEVIKNSPFGMDERYKMLQVIAAFKSPLEFPIPQFLIRDSRIFTKGATNNSWLILIKVRGKDNFRLVEFEDKILIFNPRHNIWQEANIAEIEFWTQVQAAPAEDEFKQFIISRQLIDSKYIDEAMSRNSDGEYKNPRVKFGYEIWQAMKNEQQ